MLRQIIIYIILTYDVIVVAFIMKKLFSIPGNKKLLNQYKKQQEKRKEKSKVYYVLHAILFLLGLIYLCFC